MIRHIADACYLIISALLIYWAVMAFIDAASDPYPTVCAGYAPSDCAAAAEIAGGW